MVRPVYNVKHYVERQSQERVFNELLERSEFHRKCGLLFHGDGGSGKSWLFEHLKAKLAEKHKLASSAGLPGYCYTFLSLDSGNERQLLWFEALRLNMQFNLGAQPKLSTHFRYFKRFDTLFMIMSTLEGRKEEHLKYGSLFSHDKYVTAIEDGLVDNFLKYIETLASEAAKSSLGIAAQVVEATPVNALFKFFGAVGEQRMMSDAFKKFADEFEGAHLWGVDECLERLPLFLARDLNELAEDFPQNKTVILIDGHDRVFSQANPEQGGNLERLIRTFCEELETGTIVLFSQYKIDWLKEGKTLSEMKEPGQVLLSSSSQDNFGAGKGEPPRSVSDWEDEASFGNIFDLPFANGSEQAIEDTASSNPTSGEGSFSEVVLVSLQGFETRAEQLDLVARLGMSGHLHCPAMEGILETTSLPFELHAKLTYLKENLGRFSGDKAKFVNPFSRLFEEIMANKPQDEAWLLKLLWYLTAFDRSMLETICDSLNVAVHQTLLDHVLGSGMIVEADEPGFFKVEHHYKKLLWDLRRNEGGNQHQQPDSRADYLLADDRVILADALQRHIDQKRKEVPLHQMAVPVGDLLNSCVLSGTSKSSTDKRLLSGRWQTEQLSRIFNTWFDFLEDIIRQEAPSLWLKKILGLRNWALSQIRLSQDNARPHLAAFVLLFVRANELAAEIFCTAGRRYEPADARDCLFDSRELLTHLAEKRFVSPLSPAMNRYWLLRTELLENRLSPHWSNARGAGYLGALNHGVSLTQTLRCLDDFKALIKATEGEIDQTVERHHRILEARILSSVSKQLRRSSYASSRKFANESKEIAHKLYADFPADLSVVEELVDNDPDVDNGALSLEDYSATVKDLSRFVDRGHRSQRIVFWLEKAKIRLARSYIAEAADNETMPEEADRLLKENYVFLAELVANPKSAPFELLRLYIKSVRKTAEIYKGVRGHFEPEEQGIDSDLVVGVVANVIETLRERQIHLGHPAFHEINRLAQLNAALARRFLDVVTTNADRIEGELGKARWLIILAKLWRTLHQAEGGASLETPVFVDAIKAIDLCPAEHDEAAKFASARKKFAGYELEAQIRRTAETGTFFGKGEWVLDLKDNWSGYELTKFVGLAADISSDHRQEAVRLLEEFLPLVLDAQPLDLRSYSEGMTLYLSLTEEPQRKLDVEPEAISRLSSDLADNPSEQSGYSALFAAKTYQARLEQESWDRATRILAAALISLEPELPADSHLRQKLRREYAAAVWQGLQAQRAAKRHQLVSRIPPSEGWLETFAQGSTETFVDDLLDVLYRFPVPPKPYPGDLLVADFDEITEKSATNGPGNQPGKAIVGKWGGHEVSLASNLISVQEYHLLQGTGEEDREAGPGEEGQPDQEEAFTETAVPLSEALAGARETVEPPSRLLVSLMKPRPGFLPVSQRGWQHVMAAVDLLYPGIIGNSAMGSRLALGASNSWLLCFLPLEHKTVLLSGDGWFLNALKSSLGLRRITLSQTSPLSGRQGKIAEIEEFRKVAYKSLSLIELTGGNARFLGDEEENRDPRKDRTFISMFKKLFPGVMPRISGPDGFWVRSVAGSEGQAFEENLDQQITEFEPEELDTRRRQKLVVERLKGRSGRVQGAELANEDGIQVTLSADVLRRSGLVIVLGQSLWCKVYRDGETYRVSDAKPFHIAHNDLEEFTVLDIDRSAQRFKIQVPMDSRQLDVNEFATVEGNLQFAEVAIHRKLTVGDVLLCEVRRDDADLPILTYVKGPGGEQNLLTRQDLTVLNFSPKNDAYYLEGEGVDRLVKLPMAMLRRIGYHRLQSGDAVSATVRSNWRFPVVSRLLECSRRIYWDVEGTIKWELEPDGGRRCWLVEISRPQDRGLRKGLQPLFLHEAALPQLYKFPCLPEGAKVHLTMQEEPNNRYSITRVQHMDLLDQGRWILGQVSSAQDGNLLFLNFSHDGEQLSALIPPQLHDCFGHLDQCEAIWKRAKIAATPKGYAVCDLHQMPRIPGPLTNGRIVPFREGAPYAFEKNGRYGFVELEDGTRIKISQNAFLDAGLPDRHIIGLPVACQIAELGDKRSISFVQFNHREGHNDLMCYLLPARSGAEGRVLQSANGDIKIFVHKSHYAYNWLCDEMPGQYLSVKAYLYEGKWRLLDAVRENEGAPWKYGFYQGPRSEDQDGQLVDEMLFRVLGAEDRVSFPRWMLREREADDLKFGDKVRFTVLETKSKALTPGMFERAPHDDDWFHEGYVAFYNQEKDFGKIVMIRDRSAEIRFNAAAFQVEADKITKSMPVEFSLQRDNRTNLQVSKAVRRNIKRLPWTEASLDSLNENPSYGFVEIQDADGERGLAYLPATLVEMLGFDDRFGPGARLFCQFLPGAERPSVVNAVMVPEDGLADNERILVASFGSAHRRPGRFTDLFTGDEFFALPGAYLNEEEGDMTVLRDEIVHVSTRQDGQAMVVDAILSKIGKATDFSPNLDDVRQELDEADEAG